jgi:hypothetical protein
MMDLSHFCAFNFNIIIAAADYRPPAVQRASRNIALCGADCCQPSRYLCPQQLCAPGLRFLADDLSKQDLIGSHEPLMSCLCDLLTSADVDTTRLVSGTLAKLCFRCVNNQVAVVERHGGLLGLLSLCECADTESRHNAAAVIVQLARQPSLKEYVHYVIVPLLISHDFSTRRLVLKSATMRTMTTLLASQDSLCRRHAAAVTDSLSKHPQLQEKVGSESGTLAAITIALGCSDGETIKHSVRAVANLARCAPLQPRMGKVTGMIAALTQLLRASDSEVLALLFPIFALFQTPTGPALRHWSVCKLGLLPRQPSAACAAPGCAAGAGQSITFPLFKLFMLCCRLCSRWLPVKKKGKARAMPPSPLQISHAILQIKKKSCRTAAAACWSGS